MSGTRRLGLYNIPAHLPFLDTLARGVIEEMGEAGQDPTALSRVTILLPTRRAAMALREAFLRCADGRTMLLPVMRALTGLSVEDADELALPGLLDLPPAVDAARRQAVLTSLVLRLPPRYGGPNGPEQAWRLARALGELLDEIALEGCDPARLPELVPEEFATHWQVTITFLRGVVEAWEGWLEEQGLMDIGPRRVAALKAQAQEWRDHPPAAPVFAAGIGAGGTIPAAAELLRVVATLPRGAVILHDGVEKMSAELWEAIAGSPTHPLAGQYRLLRQMGAVLEDIRPWHGLGAPGLAPEGRPSGDPALARRAELLARAMRPAAGLDAWLDRQPEYWKPALDGLSLLDAPDVQAEAVSIALLLRQALETPGARAALITPDRDLGRRVAAELTRHGILADDSAGQPLGETPAGAFLRLLARAVAEGFAPAPLLALIKHPLAAGGMSRQAWMEAVRLLERRTLRGPRPAPGMRGLRARAREALGREKDAPLLARALDLLDALERALGDFLELPDGPARPPADLLEAHLAAAEALAATETRPGGLRLYAGEEGEPLAVHLASLQPAFRELAPMSPASWPALFDVALEGPLAPSVRISRGRAGGRHPRVAILGLLEARLLHHDLAVLGALEEGVWPQATDPGPWMSRPMRAEFGLPEPEARIGRVAADFLLAAASAPDAVLARARKRAGSPTVPSRWLTRLETFLGGQRDGSGQGLALPRNPAAAWAAALDMPAEVRACPRPSPCPPPEARPREISVTEIADLVADPYGYYARRVLRLVPLEPLDAEVGASDYGNLVHDTMAGWTRRLDGRPWPGTAQAHAWFQEAAEDTLARAAARPGLLAFWRPRLARIGEFAVAQEAAAAAGHRIMHRYAEVAGRLTLQGTGLSLKVRADRIDRLADRSLALIDYKTGTPPSSSEVADGRAPQLPLEAAIAERGGFEGIEPASVSALTYWRLSGGGTPGEVKPVKGDPAALAADALDQTEALLRAFLLGNRRFTARPHPRRSPVRRDHDHLARVAEWGSAEGE
ncbi:double-strand break repair protein AddB [Roseomonas marmotae]|uniref:Double-strand break repair protein AddB n=1 Tax=Roseomonas marmotae TaxID=2768161 RepID=A0ABS3KCH4_9PROT|nr:double-strand break repair protein AddB [Roseomonas marmotae]MBO1075172.1 double-strand break repair protein AddB [Roseomonas marmotae]QTI79718.1 double-strand break repair protein AddB [Roseomonas marmotae]